MARTIQTVYENGALRPLGPIEGLPEKRPLTVTVEVEEGKATEEDSILGVIGICQGGTKDGAGQHDHYIYGSPKR